jgi:pyruvate,water dikinase
MTAMINDSKNIKIHHVSKVDAMHLQDVGGKAKGLAFLLSKGLNVPAFYVLVNKDIKAIMENADLLKLVITDWEIEHQISDTDLWAVRSSAADEDGSEKSFAGQFTSILNLNKNEIADGIKQVVDSYGRETNYAEKTKTFGVVIQRMLKPSYSGVFFSRDPILHYSDQPVISIIPGIGDKLVSGELDGYSIHFEENMPVFKSEDELEGEYFNEGKRQEIKCSSEEVKTAIMPHIQKMISVADHLEELQKVALDFEFAIENNELFWLQVRPITTREIHPVFEVWDNTSVEANYPNTTLPLSISFIRKTFLQAYGEGAKSLGFKKKVLQEIQNSLANMAGGIEGALYYNVSAWQTLIYEMPFGSRLSKKLPNMWGMEKTVFQKPEVSHSRFDKLKLAIKISGKLLNGKRYEREYLNLFQFHIEGFDLIAIKNDNFEELKAKYLTIENELGSKWLAPVLNGFNTILLFTLLKRKIRRSKIGTNYPNFVNDILFAEGEVKSVQLVRKFQDIIGSIYNSNELKQFFAETDAADIWSQIPLKFESFNKEIRAYINEFGNRSDQGELKLETINYKQKPVLFIQFLKSSLKGYRPVEKKTESFNYKSIVKNSYPINILNRWLLNKLISSTIKRVKARENHRFMRTDTFAVIRMLFLQIGKVLHAEGLIDDARDVLYLEMDELFDLALRNEFKTIIEVRKQKYVNYEIKERCNRYIKVKEKYFGIHQDDIVLEGNALKGTACSSGMVKDKVIIINKDTDFDQDFSEYILVAEYFEPGWVNLFYQAKGIISERGNLLSHTAIICRELNLPSIVGAKGLLKRINNGDVITMDGERGTITIHEDE